MPLYRWHGINAEGVSCQGSQDAADQHMLKNMLLMQGIALLVAREISPMRQFLQTCLHKSPSVHDSHLFFSHMAAFLQAGIPLKQALSILQGVQHNSQLRKDIRAMVVALEQGEPLFAIIKRYAYFPAYAYPLIQTSEQTGALVAALHTISAMTLADYEYQKTMRNACTGPVITITVACVVLGIATVALMPQFVQLYKQCNVKPPAIVLVGSTMAAFFTPATLLAIVCCLIVLLVLLRMYGKAWSFMPLVSRLPLIRNATFNADMLRWITIMHAYVSNGLSVVDACNAMKQSTNNKDARQLIAASLASLQAGKRLSDGFATYQGNRTVAFIQPLLNIGEETGDLAPMLVQAKNELVTIMQQQTSLFSKLIGPVLTIVTGLLIGGLLLMLYLPIMQLGSLIKF